MMSERDLIRRALHDAIEWQMGLADAYTKMCGDPQYKRSKELVKEYRALLKKRYGTSRLPMEEVLDGMTTITLEELRKRTP